MSVVSIMLDTARSMVVTIPGWVFSLRRGVRAEALNLGHAHELLDLCDEYEAKGHEDFRGTAITTFIRKYDLDWSLTQVESGVA